MFHSLKISHFKHSLHHYSIWKVILERPKMQFSVLNHYIGESLYPTKTVTDFWNLLQSSLILVAQ